MTKKTILITGCSSGIGFNAARGLREAGWRVFASCRKEKDCVRLRELGFESPLLDYQQLDTIHSCVDQVLAATGGRLDAVFNNGAYAVPGAVEDLPTEALRNIFEANVFGWHELNRRILPVMRQQGYGRIINNSSVLGLVSAPWRGAYVATKFALEGLTDTLRIEMRDTPIQIILIEPGPITSNIRLNSIPHFERWIDWKNSPRAKQYREKLLKRLYKDRGKDRFELAPDAVTAKLLDALEAKSPRARYYVTTPTYVMGFLRRILSTKTLDRLLAKG